MATPKLFNAEQGISVGTGNTVIDANKDLTVNNATITGNVLQSGGTITVTSAASQQPYFKNTDLSTAQTKILKLERVQSITGRTATGTISTNTLTISSATDVTVGMVIVAGGGQIPANTTITNVVGSTLTLSNNLTAGMTAVSVTITTPPAYIASNAEFPFIFQAGPTGATNLWTMGYDGKLGLGGTPSPTELLLVNGNMRVANNLDVDGTLINSANLNIEANSTFGTNDTNTAVFNAAVAIQGTAASTQALTLGRATGYNVYASGAAANYFAGNTYFGTLLPSISARIVTSIADGLYPFVVSGTTKGLRIMTNSTSAVIQGVDSTIVGSFQPLTLGGSELIFNSNGTTEAMKIHSSGGVSIGDSTDPGDNNLRIAGNIGIGENTAASKSWVAGSGTQRLAIASTTAFSLQTIKSYNANSNAGGLIALAHSKGAAIGTESATSSGDLLGAISFEGVNSANGIAGSAYIGGYQDGAAGTTYVPGRIGFYTSIGGTTAPEERMRIHSSGGVSIGDSTDPGDNNLRVAGNATIVGDLTVSGTTTTVNTTNLAISDALVQLASGNSTGAATYIGIQAERGSAGSDAYVVWEEANDIWRIATSSDGSTYADASLRTGAQTAYGTITALAAATQDAVRLQGRAGGSSSWIGTLTPTTLTASRTYTLPDSSGTFYVSGGTDVALADGGTNASLTAVNGGVVYSSSTAMAITAAGTTGQLLVSSGAGAPAFASFDLATHAPDSSYKKIVKVATTGDLSASTFSAGVISGYSQTTAVISTTSTAASTTLTVASTATIKTGAAISVASTFVPAGLTVTVASATTLTASSATRTLTTTAASGTGSTATLTFAAQTYAPFAVGATITVAGVTPTGYNGTFTVTACTTTTVSYANVTTGAQTVAGTAAQTISAGAANLTFVNTIAAFPSIDGIAMSVNDRILVKDQSTLGGITSTTAGQQNGIYYVSAVGSTTVPWTLTRTADADANTDIGSAIVNVSQGTANGGKTFQTYFKETDTLNTTVMYWNRVVDASASALIGTPTTAVGIDIATDTTTQQLVSGAVTDLAINSLGIKTITATAASTYTRASTLYIAGAPVASTNATITDAYGLYIANGKTHMSLTSAATAATTDILVLDSQSSGTPAAGIGTSLAFATETAAGNTEYGMRLKSVTTDVTGASEDFDFIVDLMAAGGAATEKFRVGSSGNATFAGNTLTVGGAPLLRATTTGNAVGIFDTTTGTITVGSTTSPIDIGVGAATGAIRIGSTTASAQNITIGGTTTGTINIGATSGANTINIGTTASTVVQLPSGKTKVGQTTLTQGGAVTITLPTAAGTLIGTGDSGTITTAMYVSSTSVSTGVTYAKMQYASAQYRVLGRITAAAGVIEELTPDNIITVINQGSTAINSARLTLPSGLTSGSASAGYLQYAGTTATAGQLDGGTTTPTGTTRLNYGGYFYPTYINLVGSADTATAATHYFVETGTDGYVRPKTLANAQTEIVTAATVAAVTQTAGSATASVVKYNGTTAAAGQFDGGTTAPSGTTRLNYGGYLYATELHTDSLESVNTTPAAATPTMYPGVTTGSITIGNGLTTGTVNIASAAAGAKTINIGTSTGTVRVYGSTIQLPNAGTPGAGKLLQSDASGNATWQTITAGATLSAVAASTTYYIGLSAGSSGSWTDARVDTADLYYTSGDSTLYATNFNTSSDSRLKDNILTIDSALTTVNNMRGVSYNWKNTGKKSYGVVAQEIEKLLPELVNEVDDRKSVNYNALIGFLIEAVKELSAKVDELSNENKEL